MNDIKKQVVLELSFDMCSMTDSKGINDFVAEGADVNYLFCFRGVEDFPLCRALNEDVAQALIDCGADINKKNSKGQTAIMLNKNPYVVAYLVDTGADVQATDNEGKNAVFHHAGNIPLMTYLVRSGCNPFIKDSQGKGIMHYMKLSQQKQFHAELLKIKQELDTAKKEALL